MIHIQKYECKITNYIALIKTNTKYTNQITIAVETLRKKNYKNGQN